VTKVQGLQQCIEEQHPLPLMLPLCDNSQTKHHIKQQIELCPADYSDFPHFTCSLECEAWMCFTYSFCSVTCNRCSHYPLMSSFEYIHKNWELLITYNLTPEKKRRNGPTIVMDIPDLTTNQQQSATMKKRKPHPILKKWGTRTTRQKWGAVWMTVMVLHLFQELQQQHVSHWPPMITQSWLLASSMKTKREKEDKIPKKKEEHRKGKGQKWGKKPKKEKENKEKKGGELWDKNLNYDNWFDDSQTRL